MPPGSEERRALAAYAVWFNRAAFRRPVLDGLQAVWDNTRENYVLRGGGADTFEPFLPVGPCLLLALVGDAWSPGDIGGFLRGKELIPAECDVMALRLDSQWYIPHHGLVDASRREEFSRWQAQLREFWLVRR